MKIVENKIMKKISAVAQDGKLNIKELKVYKGEKMEVKHEEETYRETFESYFNQMISSNDDYDQVKIPLFSYPTVIDCLGAKP